jgi:hypothetical protein
MRKEAPVTTVRRPNKRVKSVTRKQLKTCRSGKEEEEAVE